MKKFLIIPLFIMILFCCKNESTNPELEPCELYATGIFKDSLPGEIPQNYWLCMETKELVEAVSYNFPSLYILMAGCCGLQSGYDIVKHKYGFPELESREDAHKQLIAKYISIDTTNYTIYMDPLVQGGYEFYTYNMEVLLSQKIFLKNSTDEQKLKLINELLLKQDIRDNFEPWGRNEGPTFAIARVMYYSNYSPLIDSINNNQIIKTLVDLGDIYTVTEEGHNAQSAIFKMAKNFINELKNTK